VCVCVCVSSSAYVGRCDLNEFGEAVDKKLTKNARYGHGFSVDEDTPMNAKLMIGTYNTHTHT